MSLDMINDISMAKGSKKYIDIDKLNKNQYIMSLMEECVRKDILNKEDVVKVQLQIMDILKELIIRYTKGESTSTTIDTTESLLNSILYCVDFYLLKFNNPLGAITAIKQKSIKEIYEEGIELVRLCIDETKKLYEKIKKKRLTVELEAYNSTLDEALPCFFEKYSMIFEAHNTMASIDYPLVFDDMRVRGISYIKNYLEHLHIETEFCRLFLEQGIKKIISGFGRMCRLNHNIELINIFELLINNSIFAVLSGNNAAQISISKYQYSIILEKFRAAEFCEISVFIDKAIEKVIKDLKINNPMLIDYIKKYEELLVKRIKNALENDSLRSLIVIDEDREKEKIKAAFNEVNRMREEEFRSIIDSIMRLSKTADKIAIINSSIYSLHDFIDILEADCIFGEEFEFLFSTLGEIELTILAKIVFYEELRDGLTDLSLITSNKIGVETEWQECFIKFIQELDKDKKQRIEELLDEVDYEEIKFY